MKKIICLSIFFLLNANNALGQILVEKIWTDLVRSTGNEYMQPKLKIIEGQSSGPAFFRNGTIYYDSIFFDSLSIKYDKEFVELSIAYLLSHELGHFQLRHSDTHVKKMAYANTETKEKLYSSEFLKKDLLRKETDADLYGGLFSVQAGYYSLAIAREFLKEVYEYYELPPNLPGYPSLEERISSAEKLERVVSNINESYQIALALAYLGEHETSQEILKSIILESNFRTPEILHVLSYSLFLRSISELENEIIRKWEWPVQISFNAVKYSKTRSTGDHDIIESLKEAIELETDALELENKISSNLKDAIELIIAFHKGELKSFLKQRELDESLKALSFILLGKSKKASRSMKQSFPDPEVALDTNSQLKINSDDLLELRFANSKNVVLNGRRIAKKRSIEGIIWYEIRSPNGVKINLYRQDFLGERQIDRNLPYVNLNSVTFYTKHESIKYFLE